MLVKGVIEFPEVLQPLVGATLWVRLQDVSRADADGQTVAEQVLRGKSVSTPGDQLAFALEAPVLDPRGTYTIEAHLDIRGSGDVEVGDYRTMEHFGVDPRASEQTLTVRVHPIL